ncbi:hypothetical protein CL689_05515 [Candidatus Saccharibacteria bacterium]|nr:hypothetical protein [Candidatus Saccharibacteria bacterium]MBJ58332.1 hypothetical protein [Candidatus Saccharibacteria bacterium]MBQ69501.1 hypothetical protein [Candidatus Saccharibacteria bacterium]|tara:strand:+ start:275 stop:1360 length:1086 start_codon:yes stop_codon:yes gene_type:complete
MNPNQNPMVPPAPTPDQDPNTNPTPEVSPAPAASPQSQPATEAQPQPTSTPVEPVSIEPNIPAADSATPQPFNPFGATSAAPEAPAQSFAAAPVSDLPQQPAPLQPVGGPAITPPPQSNKPKKGLKLGLILGGSALVLVVLGTLAYFVFFNVTRDDYVAVHEQLELISDTVDDVNVTTGTSSEDQIADAKEQFETFKTEHAKLGSMKAILFDSEVREKYEAYNEKAEAFIALFDDLLPSFEKLLAANEVFEDLGDFTPENVQKVVDAYEAVGEVPDAAVNEYVQSTIEVMTNVKAALEQYEAAGSSADQYAAMNKVYDEVSKLSEASTKLADDVQERIEEVNPQEAFEALSDTVASKANGE